MSKYVLFIYLNMIRADHFANDKIFIDGDHCFLK